MGRTLTMNCAWWRRLCFLSSNFLELSRHNRIGNIRYNNKLCFSCIDGFPCLANISQFCNYRPPCFLTLVWLRPNYLHLLLIITEAKIIYVLNQNYRIESAYYLIYVRFRCNWVIFTGVTPLSVESTNVSYWSWLVSIFCRLNALLVAQPTMLISETYIYV